MKIKFLVLLFSMLLMTTAFSCGGGNSSTGSGEQATTYEKNLPVKMPTRFDYNYQTTNGVKIRSVVPISDDKQMEVFEAIEHGIQLQLNATTFYYPQWVNARNLNDYTVTFINPDATNVETDPGSPALLYNGVTQTAGTCLGFGTVGANYRPQTLVLPHQADTNWTHLNYLKESSRNESEHFVEGANDLSVWQEFAIHNDHHPHRSLPNEQ